MPVSLEYSPGGSYVAGLVHVREEPGDGHVADGLLEEHLLDGGRAHRAERRQQQEQLAEAARLGRVPGGHERSESNVSVPPGVGEGFRAQTVCFRWLFRICSQIATN